MPNTTKLDLTNLRNSIASLKRVLGVYDEERAARDDDDPLVEGLRAGIIQNFEFTNELCWKFMKRWIEKQVGSTDMDGTTKRELFRVAARNKLISDVDKWMEFYMKRNLTSHTYNEETSFEVLDAAREFLPYANALLAAIESRNE